MTNREQHFTPTLGDYVLPDGWVSRIGGVLQPGDAYVDESYQGAPFRLTTGLELIPTLPVSIKITGRTVNWRKFSAPAMRCRIEWIQDGEPSEYSHGWIVLHSATR